MTTQTIKLSQDEELAFNLRRKLDKRTTQKAVLAVPEASIKADTSELGNLLDDLPLTDSAILTTWDGEPVLKVSKCRETRSLDADGMVWFLSRVLKGEVPADVVEMVVQSLDEVGALDAMSFSHGKLPADAKVVYDDLAGTTFGARSWRAS